MIMSIARASGPTSSGTQWAISSRLKGVLQIGAIGRPVEVVRDLVDIQSTDTYESLKLNRPAIESFRSRSGEVWHCHNSRTFDDDAMGTLAFLIFLKSVVSCFIRSATNATE